MPKKYSGFLYLQDIKLNRHYVKNTTFKADQPGVSFIICNFISAVGFHITFFLWYLSSSLVVSLAIVMMSEHKPENNM